MKGARGLRCGKRSDLFELRDVPCNIPQQRGEGLHLAGGPGHGVIGGTFLGDLRPGPLEAGAQGTGGLQEAAEVPQDLAREVQAQVGGTRLGRPPNLTRPVRTPCV